jgi:hypothetical protein
LQQRNVFQTFQRVDLPVGVERTLDHAFRDPRFAQIPADRQKRHAGLLAQFTGGDLEPIVLNVADDELGALLSEPLGDDTPEPLCRPGYDRYAPFIAPAMGRLSKGQGFEHRARLLLAHPPSQSLFPALLIRATRPASPASTTDFAMLEAF